jgi:hypothetical protein
MAKLTRVFAVAAFVLGLGLAAAQSTSAQTAANGGGEEDPFDLTVLANLFVQDNAATVDQDNANAQNAANVIAVDQSASCTVGNNSNYNTCLNIQTSVVIAEQDIDQEQDVEQENDSEIEQENEAEDVEQENELED